MGQQIKSVRARVVCSGSGLHGRAFGGSGITMASLPPGTVLGSGRYRVLKEVNRGGTAVVYECETIPSGEHVALKVRRLRVADVRSPRMDMRG